ncbi:MAG: LysR family transcriptional regulator [Rhodospirillaceae bacterium]|jgi:DNA-binding transcriptional LysR family regulator|nr:LysR family transcriptional regulator [Rhodospirillaceae bacterium]MBT5079305.1 LysR family transcriptional regulator [Rhodospirillaceae bacterium]MBT5525781.1 LysR family transcriptional regulator [Rhodospirillaceae bacterium]MBT5880152.1 LysR family transcriptional regulator [Rhodospirillaceae bacterium]MBT6590785.1 LysR family transcriptional regulator [Rhodospirillaceae bacterium]
MQRDLEIDLLRAFVAVATHKNFTQAAGVLGRTQSAISIQIKRLEEIAGLRLFERTNKAVTITAQGETLLDDANRILQLNDEALSRLHQPEADGLVRIGTPDDYATYLLPQVLSDFSTAYPRVQVEVVCDDVVDLLRRLDQGKLDLVVAAHPNKNNSGEFIRREPLHWVAASNFYCEPGEPVPLVIYPHGSVCREIALKALGRAGTSWRIAYSTRSVAVIHNAVAAGSGVAVSESATIEDGFEILDGRDGFPPLQDIVIALHRRAGSEALAAVALAAEYIVQGLKNSAMQ